MYKVKLLPDPVFKSSNCHNDVLTIFIIKAEHIHKILCLRLYYYTDRGKECKMQDTFKENCFCAANMV